MGKTTDYTVAIDPLAVGLTRPPLFMGINLRLFFANVIFSVLLCVDTHTFYGIPIFILLHLVMLRCSAKEPNFFQLWLKGFSKTPPVLNFNYWGKVNSYVPW
jgi:type IV secretion system protein VirB3